MFWLPILNPFLQIALLPMAAAFYFYPDTIWTKPELFPQTYPESLYTWAVGKILFFGTYILLPLTFFGHPLNYTILDELNTFTTNNYAVISSKDTALIFILLWMSLPYIVPFAWANNFYMWYLQLPLEYALWTTTNLHLTIHRDSNCNIDSP